MTKKRRGFLLFCCSLIPGAGEMYMGFMKMGVSLMSLFMLTIAITDIMEISIGMLFTIVLWFYSFFHVHNLAGLSDVDFAQVQDDFLFHRSDLEKGKNLSAYYKNVFAGILIFCGVALLWKNVVMYCIRYDLPISEEWRNVFFELDYMLPKIIFSFLIIALGIHMIRGKKVEIELRKGGEDSNEQN